MENYLGNPNLKKVNTSQEYTKEQILEYQKCMNDPLYFIESYMKIISLDEGLIDFKPYNFQTANFDNCRFPFLSLSH